MKRPTWATVVGVLGIIFGCLGIIGAGQEIFMPKIMQAQKEMFSKIEETVAKQQPNKQSVEIFKTMEKMWEVPTWFGQWSMFTGIAKALISAMYLLASIWLLMIKSVSIRLFYLAAGLSCVLGIIKCVVAFSALSSFIGIAMAAGSTFGSLIDIVLIIAVATGDKSAFQLASPQSVSMG
jgi:hypothetical protein